MCDQLASPQHILPVHSDCAAEGTVGSSASTMLKTLLAAAEKQVLSSCRTSQSWDGHGYVPAFLCTAGCFQMLPHPPQDS